MYEAFYGLGGRPFELTPDPRFLLLTRKHREALALVRYVLSGRVGLALLTGEAGTGKTTLLRAALHAPPRPGCCLVTLDNPALTRSEFFEFLADGFHLGREAGLSKTRVLRELTQSLTERQQDGGVSALLVDEAQSLSDELLEEIRLLANIETQQTKLLSILLAGQPELARRLGAPGLSPLKQRIALRSSLEPLSLTETADCIAGRLRIVGGDVSQVFTREAVRAVFTHAGGVPRSVSVICENALIAGFGVGARPIDSDLVMEVCRDLDLQPVNGGFPAPLTSAPPDEERPQPVPEASAQTVADAEAKAGERFAGPPVADAGSRPTDDGLLRWGMLGRLPFWKRSASAPLRLKTQYFDVDGRQGVLVTPVTDERPGKNSLGSGARR
jgi:general secretion pathway protein A